MADYVNIGKQIAFCGRKRRERLGKYSRRTIGASHNELTAAPAGKRDNKTPNSSLIPTVTKSEQTDIPWTERRRKVSKILL